MARLRTLAGFHAKKELQYQSRDGTMTYSKNGMAVIAGVALIPGVAAVAMFADDGQRVEAHLKERDDDAR